jgi:hypothetical protein
LPALTTITVAIVTMPAIAAALTGPVFSVNLDEAVAQPVGYLAYIRRSRTGKTGGGKQEPRRCKDLERFNHVSTPNFDYFAASGLPATIAVAAVNASA